MAKQKIFFKTDLRGVKAPSEPDPSATAMGAVSAARRTRVDLTLKPGRGSNGFDFKSFYGTGNDQITEACRVQIERLLNNQDEQCERATIASFPLCQTSCRL